MIIDTKVKLSSAFIICFLLVAIFYDRRSDTGKKTDKKASVKRNMEKTNGSKDNTNKDLYYLKHPYLTKADQLNDERKYDSAIYYYRKASLKFERERQWENYVWVNSYIARL